jgi:hypothetical protein
VESPTCCRKPDLKEEGMQEEDLLRLIDDDGELDASV